MARILVNLLEDKSAPVRAMAVRRLGNLNDVRAITVLEKLQAQPLLARLSADPDRLVSTEATLVLAAFRLNRMLDNPAPLPNLIQKENSKPGSSDWQLTRVKVDKAGGNFRSSRHRRLLLAADRCRPATRSRSWSAPTRRRPFQIEIFRTGYYGGKGARLMNTLGPFQGKAQPVPARRRTQSARMPVGAVRRAEDSRRLGQRRLPGPADHAARQTRRALLAELRGLHRPRSTARPTFSFSAATTPGKPTIAGPTSTPSTPIPRASRGPGATSASIAPMPSTPRSTTTRSRSARANGCAFEFPLAYWLEQHGYDVSYCSNSDMLDPDRRPEVQGVPERGPRRVLGHPGV